MGSVNKEMALKTIPLTKGKFAIVDDEDYEWLSQWKWHINSHGYVVRFNDRYCIQMHRLIIETFIREFKNDEQADHKNRIRHDNRKTNLRIVTREQNQRNRASNKNTSSKYKGVVWHKTRKKWQAQIKIKRKYYYLGVYDNEKEAAKIYDQKAKSLFGEYAWLNFPEDI